MHRIPVNYTRQATDADYAFERLKLGYRGAERQAPSVIRKGKMFFNLTLRAKQQDHSLVSRKSDREILDNIIKQYNSSKTVRDVKKWQIDDVEAVAISNFSLRVDPAVQILIENHLHKYKWVDSGLP